MPDANEEITRILREQTDRIDRLENAEYRESVPNPIIDAGSQVVEMAATTSVDRSYNGGFQWGDPWSVNSWAGQPLFFDGFEGSLSNWSVDANATMQIDGTGTKSSAPAYEGGSSAYLGASNADGFVASAPVWSHGGVQISKIQFLYYETTNSTGGGFRLKNSAGTYELGAATDNPGWSVDDGNGFVQHVGTGSMTALYDQWNRITVWFDWQNGTYTLEWSRPNQIGTADYVELYRRQQPLITGTDIQEIELWDQTGENWQSSNLDMWVDSILIQ